MDKERIEELEKSLDGVYKHWGEIRRDTINSLGEEDALHIINYHANNWIDMIYYISSEYSQEEQMNIVYIQFTRLFKEIIWMQFLFHTANYALIYRNLRYILEMMAQAYYIDTKYPDVNLDEQFEKVTEIEDNCYGWKIVKPVLNSIFEYDQDQPKLIDDYNKIWKYLNKHVHASAKQIGIDLDTEEKMLSLGIDNFNRDLALDTLKTIDAIFDVVYIITINKNIRIKKLISEDMFIGKIINFSPNTFRMLKSV